MVVLYFYGYEKKKKQQKLEQVLSKYTLHQNHVNLKLNIFQVCKSLLITGKKLF